MKRKVFTLLMAFLTTVGNAVWGQTEETLTITSGSPTVTVTGSNVTITQEGTEQIANAKISFGGSDITEYHVTINGLNLKDNGELGSGENPGRVMDIPNNVTVNLTVIGENSFYSEKAAAIFLPNNSTLVITKESTGSLTVDGFRGIGNGEGSGGNTSLGGCGTININGGTLVAKGHAEGDNEGSAIGGSIEDMKSGKLTISENTFVSLDNIDIEQLEEFEPEQCIIHMPSNAENEATVFGNVTLPSYIPQNYSLVLNNDEASLTLGPNVFITKDRLVKKETGGIDWAGKLNAYQLKLETGDMMDAEAEEEHTVTIPSTFKVSNVSGESLGDTYFGAESTITVEEATCSKRHQFLGWYLEENDKITKVILPTTVDGSCTFTAPSDTPEGIEDATYSPIWTMAEEGYEIFALADGNTEWTKDGQGAPTITVVPEEVADKFSFTLSGISKENYGVEMKGNQIVGKPTLKDTDNGLAILHDVAVSIKTKSEDDTEGVEIAKVKIDPFIFSKDPALQIYGVELTDIPHIYNGQAHNDLDNSTYEGRHLLNISAKTGSGDDAVEFTEAFEEVHYRIKSYTYKTPGAGEDEEGTTKEVTGDKESLRIIKAGTYSNIVLESLTGTFNIQQEGKETDADASETTYTLPDNVEVGAKALTLKATSKTIEISNGTDPNFATNWKDYVSVDGIVTVGDKTDDVTPTMTATVSPTTESWWTVLGNYTVTFTLSELSGDDASNYSTEGATVTRNIIVKGSAENVDIKPGTDSPWNIEGKEGFNHVYDGIVPKIGSLVITTNGGNSETLKEDEDFTVTYPTDANVGTKTATVEITNSQYITDDGTATITLTITQRPLNITFKDEVASMEGLTVTDLVVPDNLVSGEIPTYNGTIQSEETGENTYKVTITGFKVENSTTFTSTNYVIKVNSNDYTEGETIVIDKVTVDPDDEGDDDHNPGHGGSTGGIDRPAKYYNIYVDTAATSDGVELSLSKDVVKEGNQIEEGVQPGEYIIYNIYHDIYVKVTDVVKEDATGIDDLEGVKAYAKDGSIYVYTPNREEVMIISMSGAIIKNEEQVGLQSYSVSRGIYIVRIGDKVFKLKN